MSRLNLGEAIEARFPHFFHVTLGRFAPDIEMHGLCPQRASVNWQDAHYYKTTLGERKPICFCTAAELQRTKFMISCGRNVPQHAPDMLVLRIRASSITRGAFDLDRSFA